MVSPASDTITVTDHGRSTGAVGNWSSPPPGLSTTASYLIVVDSDTLAFAESQEDAFNDIRQDITGTGVANSVYRWDPTQLDVQIEFESSVDGVNWSEIMEPWPTRHFRFSDTQVIYADNVHYNHIRLQVYVRTGTLDLTAHINAKG